MYQEIISFMPQIYFIIEGTIVTLQYSSLGVLFGMMLGTILSIFKFSNFSILRIFASVHTSIFRGTPLLVQLSIIYFALPRLVGIKLNVFEAGVLAFSLNSSAYISEIIRAGINSVDKGQFEAAKALAIPPILCMKDIILPQAFRNILPALINELVNMVKESALISVIGGMDLMKRAQLVSGETYNYFLPMMTSALAYYLLVVFISSLAKILEKRLAL